MFKASTMSSSAMKQARILVLLLLASILAPSISATSGRAAPACFEMDLSDISAFVAVNPDACVRVDLGVRSHETVLEFSFTVADDAMDVLLFDESGILPYENGQSYRTSFVEEASFETAIGLYEFDWSPPSSITAKRWYMVIDNSAHDGDDGMGDQGGLQSRFSIDVTPANEGSWTPIHNVYLVETGVEVNIHQFAVDAGTGVSLTADVLSGSGDLFIQSDNQVDGALFIAGTKIEGASSNSQLSWSVPEYLDGNGLNLIVSANQGTPFHFTLEMSYDPPIDPKITDHGNSSTIIGKKITLDATGTPNSLNQIASLSWDFNGDGIEDGSGMLVEASWLSPGLKTVNLTAISQSGSSAVTSHEVEVLDVVNPSAVISSEGTLLNGEWRLLRNADLTLRATTSTDDDGIASTHWDVPGLSGGSAASQVTVSWSQIGTYLVNLTVIDPSGNIGKTNTTIVVWDSTNPMLETSEIDAIDSVTVNEKFTLKAIGVDPFDDPSTLVYHWDFDLLEDSDGDGDARNDPDMTGSSIDVTLSKVGEQSVRVTVYDPSGNSASHGFIIDVNPEADSSGVFGIVALVFFVFLITAGVVLFGHRNMQTKLANQLLVSMGLNPHEATVRIEEIARNRKLPPFAKAMEIAGIGEGGEIKTADQIQSAEKAAEMDSIYGAGAATMATDPNAGFRSSVQNHQPIDSAHAEAALAAFEDSSSPVQSQPQVKKVATGKVRSGGISLPVQKTPVAQPQTHSLKGDCSSCAQPFTLEMPHGVNSAVVACPSCGADNLFER
ncbi:MAG TPA: PKD domain-containing protein [Candidatus Poseidoniales archaeon]|nr:PKD domain-containing protein [Candidatus Poseidoniales archaeon]HIL65896.1 PKD domain-containing protein [Candidatus Poseidoniales archaeon]